MQLSWFVLVFEERYFIMVIGLRDFPFCIGLKKDQTLVWNLIFEFSQQRRILVHFILTLVNGSSCLRAYLSFFLAFLIRMYFSRYVMKFEFHGYQRKGIYRLKWCLRVFIGLRSLLLLYAISSTFVILLAYDMPSRSFSFRSWEKGSFQVFHFTLNLWSNT
jgi:hypothetical protein